jgi:hypothetical protein
VSRSVKLRSLGNRERRSDRDGWIVEFPTRFGSDLGMRGEARTVKSRMCLALEGLEWIEWRKGAMVR